MTTTELNLKVEPTVASPDLNLAEFDIKIKRQQLIYTISEMLQTRRYYSNKQAIDAGQMSNNGVELRQAYREQLVTQSNEQLLTLAQKLLTLEQVAIKASESYRSRQQYRAA